MAAPVPTARLAPVGTMLKDGYQTLITFAADPDVALWEKTVQPAQINGGDAIPTTTMHNQNWETAHPQSLKKQEAGQATFAYDPKKYANIMALINVLTVITTTFPDGTTEAAFGWLKSFNRAALQKGEFPEATGEIEFSGCDTNGVEQAPVVTPVSGT